MSYPSNITIKKWEDPCSHFWTDWWNWIAFFFKIKVYYSAINVGTFRYLQKNFWLARNWVRIFRSPIRFIQNKFQHPWILSVQFFELIYIARWCNLHFNVKIPKKEPLAGPWAFKFVYLRPQIVPFCPYIHIVCQLGWPKTLRYRVRMG